MARSWNAIVSPRVLVPAPFVTRCRSFTVAKADSITFVLRIVCQWAAAKSKNLSSFSSSLTSDATALGSRSPYSVTNARTCSSAIAFVSAWKISWRCFFARGCSHRCVGQILPGL